MRRNVYFNKCMKRLTMLVLLVLLEMPYNVCVAQQANYSPDDFSSARQVRDYLATNIIQLDPLEGEYDVEFKMRTNSPHKFDIDPWEWFIVKGSDSQYIIYYVDNKKVYKHDMCKVESIGTTNAYRIYWANSSARAILDNNVRLKADIELSFKDVVDMFGNSNFKYVVSLDLIKKYPTGKMYANASRKHVEETMPVSWSGTGFALKNGYVATNYHVVENAKNIKVQGVSGSFNTQYDATVISTDKNNDLAIIKINDRGFDGFGNIPYRIKNTTSDVGEDVFVLGYPLTTTMGDEIKLTTGVISSKTGFQGDVSLYQISAPIQPGNSGGPLFDGNGNLIGIVNAKHSGAENVSYAIKVSYLKNLVESVSAESILPTNNTVSGMSLSNKVKILKNYVFMIKCSTK